MDLARDEEQFFMLREETTGLPEEFMRENEEKCLCSSDERYACAFIEFIEYDCRVRSCQQRFAGLELHTYDHDKLK